MPITLLIVIGLHMAATLFWLLTSLAQVKDADLHRAGVLFRPQMIAAVVAVFTGGGLWQMLHGGGHGPREMVLGVGALCAIVAAGVQGALVGGPVRRLKTGGVSEADAARKVLLGQRIAAALLTVALVAMIGQRHV